MTNNVKGVLVAAALILALILGWFAFQEENDPLEQAGSAVDETIDDVTHPNEGPLEEAGRKVSEAVEDGTD